MAEHDAERNTMQVSVSRTNNSWYNAATGGLSPVGPLQAERNPWLVEVCERLISTQPHLFSSRSYLEYLEKQSYLFSRSSTLGELPAMIVIVCKWVKLSATFHPPTYTTPAGMEAKVECCVKTDPWGQCCTGFDSFSDSVSKRYIEPLKLPLENTSFSDPKYSWNENWLTCEMKACCWVRGVVSH